MYLTVLELASLEKKKMKTIFDFFKIRFLGFYKAELESEDIFVLRGSGLSIKMSIMLT